jgi:hypothetical protein
MAQGYSAETLGVLDGTLNPAAKTDGRLEGARMRSYRAVLDLSQATVAKNNGDTNVLCRLPRGQRVIKGIITSSVSLATATVAIGNAGTPGKYRAAAVFTATDTPTAFGVATSLDDAPLTAFEDVIMTIGTAALPGAGIVVIELLTSGR